METSWKLSLERAEYEADRAQRQYDLAEPENRLVARSLESRWNEKLTALNNLRDEHERYRLSRSWRPTVKDRDDILGLARDLPRIWKAPTTGMKDRKRMARLLIEDVTVYCEPGQKEVRLGIRWHPNCSEVLEITKPLPPSISRKHIPETVHLIGDLARNLTDRQIAEHLNTSGYRTPENRLFTADSVSWLRYRYQIPGPKIEGFSIKEVAERFGVSTYVVYYWLDHGVIKGKKLAPGWPWRILLDEETEKTLAEWAANSTRIARVRQSNT
jgi:hypothetical protein